jgi:hypothetical protein
MRREDPENGEIPRKNRKKGMAPEVGLEPTIIKEKPK